MYIYVKSGTNAQTGREPAYPTCKNAGKNQRNLPNFVSRTCLRHLTPKYASLTWHFFFDFIVLQTRRVYLPDTQVREPCFASVCTVPPVEKRAVRWRQGEAEEGEEGGGKQGVARPSGEGSYCRMSRLSGAGEGEVVSKDVGEEKRGARGADRRSDNAISVSFSLSLARSTA